MKGTSGRVLTEAERQQARYNLLTPREVAQRLSEDRHVKEEAVRSWCAAGWLQSVDIRRPGSTQPTYAIDWRWVEEFVARGGAQAFVDGAVKPWWWRSHAA